MCTMGHARQQSGENVMNERDQLEQLHKLPLRRVLWTVRPGSKWCRQFFGSYLLRPARCSIVSPKNSIWDFSFLFFIFFSIFYRHSFLFRWSRNCAVVYTVGRSRSQSAKSGAKLSDFNLDGGDDDSGCGSWAANVTTGREHPERYQVMNRNERGIDYGESGDERIGADPGADATSRAQQSLIGTVG